MIDVDLIGQIRRAYFEQHRPIKEIVRTLSVPEGYSGLAGAGRPDEQDVVVAAQEVEAGEGVDLRLADAGLAFEREGVERPPPWQMRLIEPIGEAALASRRRFRAQQP